MAKWTWISFIDLKRLKWLFDLKLLEQFEMAIILYFLAIFGKFLPKDHIYNLSITL